MTGQNWPLVIFAWRNLWRNPKRTLILILVFTLGVATMLFFQSLMQAWSKSMLDNALDNLTDTIQIHHTDYRQNPTIEQSFQPSAALIHRLQNLEAPGTSVVWAKRIRVPAMIQSEYDSLPVTLIGIQPEQEALLSFVGKPLLAGERLVANGKGIVVGQKLLSRLETQLGRRLVVMAQSHTTTLSETGIKVVGVYQHADPRVEESIVFVDNTLAEQLLKLNGYTQEIAIKVSTASPLALRGEIERITAELQQVAPQLAVEPWWALQPFIDTSIEMMDSFIWVWLGFIMVLMVFGMLNTLLMSLFERQSEFVLLHTLGMQPMRLRILILLEIIFLVLVATLLGVLLSFGFVWWGQDGISLTAFAEGAAWFGMGSDLYLNADFEKWTQVIIVTLLTTFLFSLWPIISATRHKALTLRG